MEPTQDQINSHAFYEEIIRGGSVDVALANIKLGKHLAWVNDIARSAHDYYSWCSGAGCVKPLLRDSYLSDDGPICPACYRKAHVTCKRCSRQYAPADMSKSRNDYCIACDADETQAEIAILQVSIHRVLSDWEVEPDCLDRLCRTLAYVQKLRPRKNIPSHPSVPRVP
jgi:hypothetical protein